MNIGYYADQLACALMECLGVPKPEKEFPNR